MNPIGLSSAKAIEKVTKESSKIIKKYKRYFPIGGDIYNWCNKFCNNDSQTLHDFIESYNESTLNIDTEEELFDYHNENNTNVVRLFFILQLAKRPLSIRDIVFYFESISKKETKKEREKIFRDLFCLVAHDIVKMGISKETLDNGALDEVYFKLRD